MRSLVLAGYKLVFGGEASAFGKDTIPNPSSSSAPHKRSIAFVVGNMFSAGVMVSAGLCHLLGEAIRDMNRIQSMSHNQQGDDVRKNTYSHEFPWATFLCGCGLLVTLCADKLASIVSQQQYGVSCCPGSPMAAEGHLSDDKTLYRGSIELSGIPAASEDIEEREPLNRGLNRNVSNRHPHLKRKSRVEEYPL